MIFALAKADTIEMKNGDVYRGKIIKESFNEFVQIGLSDGSEKHLLWTDIQTATRDDVIPSPKIDPSPNPSVPSASIVPVVAFTPPPESNEPFHIELDFTSISLDNYWENASANNLTANENVHTFLTSPEDFSVRVLPGRWMLQGRYYSNLVNADGTSGTEQKFSDFAFAYGVTHNFYVGIWGSFSRSSIAPSNSNQQIDQDYAFGPYMRGIIPIASFLDLELQAAVGPDFRALSDEITLTGTSLAATESLYFAFRLSKAVKLLVGAEGWQIVGSLNLNDTVINGQTSPAETVTDNIYRLRIVPIGLRLQF